MWTILVLHEGRMVLYGPFDSDKNVKKYIAYHKLADQHYIVLPLHDSGDCLDADLLPE